MTVLETRAKKINDSGSLKYDEWSTLTKAVHMERQLTVYGVSKLGTAKLSERTGGVEGYLESRVAQAANFLCHDDTMMAALAEGARFVYQWKDADGAQIGMVTAQGDTYCADAGY